MLGQYFAFWPTSAQPATAAEWPVTGQQAPHPKRTGERAMAKAGDVIENPVTGERIVFVETAAQSGGERLKIALHLEPNANNASSHLHAKQAERIAVVRGELRIVVGRGEARTLRAGEEVVVPAGVLHQWWNHGGRDAEI